MLVLDYLILERVGLQDTGDIHPEARQSVPRTSLPTTSSPSSRLSRSHRRPQQVEEGQRGELYFDHCHLFCKAHGQRQHTQLTFSIGNW